MFAPLFGAKDCIICDAGVHPSLAEGARLAGARLVTFRSDDPDDLEDILRRSRWARFRAVVTNGVHPFTGRILRETVNHLYDRGIYCHGLCYPVVPEGEARIRLMVSALHSEVHIQQTLNAFESAREVAAFAVDALDALGGLQ